MFTFKPYDDSDINGLRKDDLTKDQKNEFHFSVHCEGFEQLDDVLYVRMNRKVIQFFRESDEVSDAQRDKVVATISLTNPKDTGNDLLFFAEHIRKGSLIPKDCEIKANNFLNRTKAVFFDFPFITDQRCKYKWNNTYENPDQVFFRLCLLEFLLAVDTHDEIFAITLDYDEIRETLRKSKVYLLLCAKLRYCMYHYKGREALNPEEYTFVVSKLSGLLMDGDYNKMVPSDYYDKPRFLYNPEKELRSIMGRNDSKLIDEAVRNKIRDFFLTKHAVIESFWCVFRPKRKANFIKGIHLFIMLAFVVSAFISMIDFESGSSFVKFFYNNSYWALVVIIAALFEILCAFFRFKSVFFHPRIVVALLMGWLTIAISDDLIKSQLNLNSGLVLWTLIIVAIIVGMMLWGEVRLHSPYYLRWSWKIKNYPKITVILVYAMFWNLIFGIVMQNVTYKPLLESSGAMPKAMLGQLPNEVEKYKNTVETCISMLDDYDRSMEGIIHDYGVLSETQTMVKKDSSVIKNDTISFVTYTTTTTINYNQSNNKSDLKQSISEHNDYLNSISDWIFKTEREKNVGFLNDTVENCMYIMYILNDTTFYAVNDTISCLSIEFVKEKDKLKKLKFETINPAMQRFVKWLGSSHLNKNITDENEIKESIRDNLLKARAFKSEMYLQLAQINEFYQKECDEDALLKAATVNSEDNQDKSIVVSTKNYYLAFLKASINTKFRRGIPIGYPSISVKEEKKVDNEENDDNTVNNSLDNINKELFNSIKNLKLEPVIIKEIHLFPRMLIFHSLIVLIIAFVGNLIISDRSVTEPL